MPEPIEAPGQLGDEPGRTAAPRRATDPFMNDRYVRHPLNVPARLLWTSVRDVRWIAGVGVSRTHDKMAALDMNWGFKSQLNAVQRDLGD